MSHRPDDIHKKSVKQDSLNQTEKETGPARKVPSGVKCCVIGMRSVRAVVRRATKVDGIGSLLWLPPGLFAGR